MSQERELTIRWAGPGDEQGLLPLLTDAYRRWPRVETHVDPLDYLLWKYEWTTVQSSRCGLALDGERFVGAIPLITRTFQVDGCTMQSATALDVAVHPDYREAGVYMKMQNFIRPTYRNSVDFNFGYAGPHPAMARARVLMGDWPLMAHHVDVLAANTGKIAPTQAVPGVTVERVARVDETVDALCDEAMHPFRLSLKRDHGYLNWRYCDPRGGDAALLLAREGSEPIGLAAVRISNGIGYLADVFVLPERQDIMSSLASEALVLLRERGTEKARCWIPQRHPYREALVAAGFSRMKETRAFTYELHQAPKGSLAFLTDPEAQVHVTVGDTDLI